MTRPPEGAERPAGSVSSSLEDDLAFLLLFADATLQLIPDGVVVLDAGLRVRSANAPALAALGWSDPAQAVGADLADHPLLGLFTDRGDGPPLREALERLGSEILDTELAEEEGAGWRVRAAYWDAEHPDFRRTVLWLRRREPDSPEEVAGPEPSAPAEAPGDRERPSLDEEQADLLVRLTARSERLLDRSPTGICIVDPGLRVVAANRAVQDALACSFRANQPGDRHLFSVFPPLRDEEFRERLEQCHETADPVRGTLTVRAEDESPLQVDVEVVPVAGPDRHLGELILLFHEVRGMSPAVTPSPPAAGPAPLTAEGILREENLARWSPRNRRILAVEADAWARMMLSDALRRAGEDDVTFADSAADALRHHDPAAFGLILAGFDGGTGDAAEILRRAAETAPRVPVLCVAQRPEPGSAETLSALGGLGVLVGAGAADLAGVITAVLREAGEPPETRGEPVEERVFDVALLGASDADVPVLRLIYRVQRMRIRFVFDPDPDAFGLSLAQNLGIPAVSGDISMSMERPPDVVVLARDGLEPRLSGLGLENVPRVTRDEVELFLVDPDSFLPDVPPPAEEASPAEEPPPVEESPPVEEPFSEERPEDEPLEPAEEEDGPLPDASPGGDPPRSLGAMAVESLPASPGTAAGAAAAALSHDVDSILGALDLLLDFDRFAAKVLDIALDLSGGGSGSLMVVREDEHDLRIVAARGLSELIVQRTRQRIGEGIAGSVAQTGEGRLLEGRIRDDVGRDWDRPDLRSAVCVPVTTDGRVIGVLSVNSAPEGRSFDQDTLAEVAALARKVGAALDRSILLRSMRGRSFELSVRGEIERITASAEDVGSCLRAVASRMVDMMSVDVCGIWLLDAKSGRLGLRALAGAETPGHEPMSIRLGEGLVGWVARKLQPMVLRNWGEGESNPDDPVAVVAVPIRHRTALVGVMHVESTTGRMDEDRLEILTTVASVVGQQVGGLQAHENSERKVTMLSAIGELGLAFGAVPEREGLCRLVTFSASTLLGSDVATMRVLRAGRAPSDAAEDYELLAVHGASFGESGDPLADLEACLAREVAGARLPCRDSEIDARTIRPLLERSNVEAALAMPLTSGDGELVSILCVYRVVDPRGTSLAFRDEDVEMATRLADYAAAAVQRFVEGTAPGEEPA
jgi:GAF domain-containing protein/PAS domain-containing protein